jgi:hypothetical protein
MCRNPARHGLQPDAPFLSWSLNELIGNRNGAGDNL